jgi:hypothetical protein
MKLRFGSFCLATLIVMALSCTGNAGSGAPASAATPETPPVPKSSGAKMCVLTQADFKPYGTLVWTTPKVNLDGPASAYCVYREKSGATGGVELDVFFPAGDTPSDVEQTFKTVLASNPGANYLPEGVPGADESVYSLTVPQPGYFPFAANAVRRGDLVFSISLPSSPVSKLELGKLSQIVLERLGQ